MADVEYVTKVKKPDYLYTHLTTVGYKFNFDKFINNISKRLQATPVVISGQLTHSYEKKIHPPIQFKKSFPEVMDFIAGL